MSAIADLATRDLPTSTVGLRGALLGTTALVAASLLLGATDRAAAQSYIWGGTGSTTTTNNYNLGTNWANPPAGAPPVAAGQSALFGNTGLGTVSVTAGPVAPDSWTFNASAQAYTITGAAVNFSTATGIVNNSTNAISIDNVLGGVGGLTQSGSGTLTLTGINTYTGATTVNGGTLALSGFGSIANSSVVTVNGTFDTSASSFPFNAITSLAGSSAGVVQMGGSGLFIAQGATEFAGTIAGTGGLEIGAGTQTLSGVNTYSNATQIDGGATLALKGPGSIANSAFIGFLGAGIFDISQTNSGASVGALFDLTGNGQVRLGSKTLTITSGSAFKGVISDGGIGGGAGGALAIANGATQSLYGTNTYTGGTTIAAGGELDLVSSGSIATSSGLANDGFFDISGLTNGGTSIKSLSGASAGQVNLGANTLTITNASGIFAGIIQDGGAGGSFVLSGGKQVLAGDNTYTGGTTILGGTLQLGNGTTTGSILGDVTNNGTLAFNRSDNVTFGGLISGTGGVSQIGPGTLTLTGANLYSGGTSVSGGTLAIGADNNIGTGPLALLAGSTLQFLSGFTFTHPVTVAGDPTINVASVSNTMSGVIADGTQPGDIVKTGAGSLILTANNSYTGGTMISAGTLQLGNGGTSGAIVGDVVNNAVLAVNRSDTLTLAGTISGSGALRQNGAGTTILAGANTYTGGTTISAGTLQLGDGGTTGSIAGDVVNNGTLAFNRSNALILSGVISGTGTVQQNGSGSTNLTAANTYTGPTTVNAGTLIVNGSIAASSGLTVNAGGTIGGNGTLPSTTINGGALSPGNSIGVVTINGNLVFGAGSVYVVEVSPLSADRTNVSGTATLNGTVNAIFGPGGFKSNSFTVLSAAGGRTGTFGALTTSGLPSFLSAGLSYTPTDVLVTLVSNISKVTAQSPNQQAFAIALDTAFNNGAPTIGALYSLTPAQLPGALGQLSGEVHASTAGVLADESLYVRSAILGRLRQASYGDGGIMGTMAALRLGGPQAFAGDEELNALAYAKSPIVTKAPMKAPETTSDVVFWAQGFGAWGRFDTDGNAATVRRDLAGFITGVDTRVGASGRAGLAAGYTSSRNTLDARGTANVETGHVAAYGGWSFGALNLRAGGAYAFHSVATDRMIAFPGFFDRAFANYDGGTGQIFGEAGYGFAFGNLAVEPFAGAAWVRVQTDAAAERAIAAGLNFAGTTFETGYATLGVRAAGVVALDNGMVLVPRAALAWQHAFDNVTPRAVLAFQTAPTNTFTMSGVPIARDALLAEAGLDLAINRQATIGVSYTGQIASNVQDHAAKGRFSWKF